MRKRCMESHTSTSILPFPPLELRPEETLRDLPFLIGGVWERERRLRRGGEADLDRNLEREYE
jgi:hypothetical protein